MFLRGPRRGTGFFWRTFLILGEKIKGNLPAVLRYLNLCSEEFYLCRCGYLAREVWDIWEAELDRTLWSPIVRREWPELKREFAAYPEFAAYVDERQGEA
jgi:hypothetical protein